MAAPKRTWLWVILGVFGALFLLVVVLVGGAIYGFRTHVKNETVETAAAEREFAQVRERFRGQQPLVEFVGRDNQSNFDDKATVHRPPPDAPRVPIKALRVLVFDKMENHLVRVEIPGWLLRMMPNGRFGGATGLEPQPPVQFEGEEEFARRRITIEDLERHGLGLVLEGHNRNTDILIWSE